MAQEPFLADQEDDDSEDTAPVPKTFQSKSPRTFIPHATTAAPKPKGDTFGDSVLKIGKSLVSPLPEHKPVSLPSSDEVESAARTFEADKSEPIAKGNLSTSKDPYNVQLDGKNLLLPSKDDTGRDLSVHEAIAQYRFDGKHMGEFATPEDATRHVRILNGEDATEKPKQPEVKSTDLPKIASSAPKTFQKAEDQRQSNPELDRIRGAASPDELSRITPIPGRTEKLLHFLNGYTPSELGHPEINDIKGPGLQEIPGVRHFTDKLANLVTGSEGTGRLLAGAVVKALGEIAATGTDPRTVGTGGPKPEKPAGFDSFSAEPIEPKLIGSGQTEEAAANAPARKLLGAGDTTPIDPEMSLRRARELPPDLAAPGEEATFNAARAENIAKPIEMSAYERARAATGGKELPDELARPRSTPEESARVLGDEVPATTPKSFVPHQAPPETGLSRPETQPVAEAPTVATKTPFKSPFEPKAPTQESLATTEKPTEAAAPEGKIGPYANHTPEQLVKLVATGEKPSAILENLSPSQLSQMIKSATAMGLHVEKNPIVPNEPIISKSPSVAKRLAASIDAGDHATTGKLLGYSDADIAKFQDKFSGSNLPKSFSPSVPESVHKTGLGDLVGDEPDLSGNTQMTGERVRQLFKMEPKQAIAQNLITRNENGTYQSIARAKNVTPPSPQLGRIQRMLGVKDVRDASLHDLESVYSITKGSIDPAERKAATLLKQLIDEKKSTMLPGKKGRAKVQVKQGEVVDEGNEPSAARKAEDFRVGQSGMSFGQPNLATKLRTATTEELQRVRKTIADDVINLTHIANNLPETNNRHATGMAKRRVSMAKSKLARIDEELANRNTSDNEPSAARTESGGTRMDIANVKDMIKIFRNTYAASVPLVSTKETVQNAIDAANENVDPNVDPLVHVDINRKTNEITTSDNGPGLTREMIDTVYSDLSGSGKRGKGNTIGEMGVGKVTYMIAGEHVAVDTVARDPKTMQLKRITFSGTPDQIMEEFFPKEEVVPEGTPTGTKVTVRVKDNSNFEQLDSYLRNLKDYSNIPVHMTVESHSSYYSGDNFSQDIQPKSAVASKPVGKKEKGTGANFKISIPENAVWGDRNNISLILNNRGMFQGVDSWYFGNKSDLPDRLTIDLEPTVPATDDKYPLTVPTRERLKDEIKYEIGSVIQRELVKGRRDKREKELQVIFNNASTPKGKNSIILYDSGGKLDKDELKTITSSPTIKAIQSILDITINHLRTITNLGKDQRTTVGLILDQKLRGVNLRNPKDHNDFLVMVNVIDEMRNRAPKEAAQGIVHVAVHEFTHVTVRNEGGEFTSHLATIYENFDLDAQVNLRNTIIEFLTGGKKYDPNSQQQYSSEAEKLLQIYTDSRGRDESTPEILIREAGSGIIRPEEPQSLPKDDSKDRNRTPSKSAVGRLLDALQEAKDLNEEQRGINFQERSKRFAAFQGVQQGGQAGAAKSLGKLRGEFEKVQPGNPLGDRMGQKDIDTLFNAVKQANITPGEKARGYSALFKLINGERVPPRNELDILDQVFGNGFSDKIIEMHGGLGVVGLKIGKTANTMKALRSSLDLSAPLRQGIGLIHRAEYREAFKEMFKYFANPTYFKQAMEDMEKDPMYLLAKQAGLFIADPGSLIRGEEAFMNNYLHNIPKWTGVPMATDASERAYVGFLNKLRFDTFKSLINTARVGGAEPFTVEQDEEGGKHLQPSKVTENIAKYINISTGRGNLPGFLGKIAPELNTVIWSPRLISSRLTVLNPKYYTSMDPFTRKEAIKTLLAIAAAGITIGGLAYLRGKMDSGAKVGTDPLSADFGKVRYPSGNVVDQWAGFQQPIVAASRFIANSNNVKPQSRTVTLENYTANKLSPMAALAYEVASAQSWDKNTPGQFKNRYGQKKQLGTEVLNNFVPMFTQDLYDIVKSDPSFSEAVGLGAASILGVGIQNYPESKKKPIRAFGLQRLKP